MFSQTVEYALRAVVYLAADSSQPATTEQLAAVTKVPKAYLSKVLQGLVRAGILHSQRGIGGGMTLVKSPADLTILEVVQAVEPVARIRSCPLGLAWHGEHLCPLHRRMDDALALVEQALGSSTLAEVLAEPSRSKPLWDGDPSLAVVGTIQAALAAAPENEAGCMGLTPPQASSPPTP
ncbi:transcriptional regulator, BadM/Rrf2 family [Pirellula staleyi DSM 6068]|uniref:Transcriptional regulator, BadM/Rrf2 family n=1 Tax=Pirellula staleyi (strain ATCC 27377 / DSM 6068 / ICPB 4128) TaxID=530564 RepID=D2R7K1_PIRSD|nr:Rrf2 family transcriptional regulator [Pirellula staleyi]ADB17427.1 transcriptional regulator, BadM/Rrf2 family [Pirellula staleyi DSM 6068]